MDEDRAKNYAVWLLTQQARTEKELVDKLKKKEADDETIAAVLAKLRDWGYLNDAGLAERWVESRGKTRGKLLLSQELRRKGVDAETAKETLSTRTDDDETQAARTAAIKKVGARPSDRSREAQQKLSSFLARRGFSWSAIRPVLRELYSADLEDTLPSDEE